MVLTHLVLYSFLNGAGGVVEPQPTGQSHSARGRRLADKKKKRLRKIERRTAEFEEISADNLAFMNAAVMVIQGVQFCTPLEITLIY